MLVLFKKMISVREEDNCNKRRMSIAIGRTTSTMRSINTLKVKQNRAFLFFSEKNE